MSPGSSSKSKDKKAAKVHVNASIGIPASGYNPLLGTFHSFESLPVSSNSSLQPNGRFSTIDDVDDPNGNSIGAVIEFDSVSNNESWSGESEDHKEKTSQSSRHESVPGADNEKRDKTRLKNERKHQRQRERRAQELHERCSGYLMSRKLETLAQQLVAMGFPLERAMMALILNEGRVEESVAWLFESVDEENSTEHDIDSGGNLKIDISEELTKITYLEIRYKASKQDVERAIVACDGDIQKAEEMLKASKQDDIAASALADNKPSTDIGPISITGQPTIMPSTSMQHKRDEMDFNETNVGTMRGSHSVDHGLKDIQELRKTPHKVDWIKPHQNTVATDKSVTLNPSVSNSIASPLQASPPISKFEAHYLAVGDDLKNHQLGSMREPVSVMQLPQSINAKLAHSSSAGSSPPGPAMSWHTNGINMRNPNGLILPAAVSTSIGPNGANSHALHNQLNFQPQKHLFSNASSIDSQESSRPNSSWSRGGAFPTLMAASSLGLFSGLGTSFSSGSSTVDWNSSSSMLQFDYTNIDWSVDTRSLTSRSSRSCAAMNYWPQNGSSRYTVLANRNGTLVPGLSEGGVASLEPIPNGSRDQRTAFDDKDLFSFSRQYISSPSL